MLQRLFATIEVSRPLNMLAAAACVGAGYFLAGGRTVSEVALPIVFTSLVVASGNLINDYFDAEIDRVNKPRRPIPSGRLTKVYVRSLYRSETIVLAAAAFIFLPIGLACIVVFWQILLYLYARKAKRLLLLGNVLVCVIASSAFFFGAVVAGENGSIVFPVVYAFLFNLGRELVKGAEDVEGDRLVGAATLPVRLGTERTGLVAVCILLICALLAPLPVLLGDFGFYYTILMELFVVPGLLFVSYFVLHRPNRVVLNRASWVLKIEMFFGIAAMGLGKI